MASLMEELMINLEEVNNEYKKLIDLSMKKTPIIISADLDALQRITEDEQEVVNKINHLDRKREINMKDIANVINKDVDSLKLAVRILDIDDEIVEKTL